MGYFADPFRGRLFSPVKRLVRQTPAKFTRWYLVPAVPQVTIAKKGRGKLPALQNLTDLCQRLIL